MNRKPLEAGSRGAPTMVVLGAPRCGTTSLARYLNDAGLSVGVKDSFYLMDDDAGLRGQTHLDSGGIEGYLSLFQQTRAPAVEVTAGYLYQTTALDFFTSWRTPPHFVVVVRDPIERLRSVFRYFTGNLGVLPRDSTFESFVGDLRAARIPSLDKTVSDALEQGKYARWLQIWIDRFGVDAVSVLTFDQLRDRPAEIVEQLVATAGGEPPSLEDYEFTKRNQSYTPRSELAARATSILRNLVPAGGATRARVGELIRQWHVRGETPSVELASDSETAAWLADYYAASNRALAAFGVDVSNWTAK